MRFFCKVYEIFWSDLSRQYPEEIIDRIKVKPLLLGDSAYPLGQQLIKPYLFRNGIDQEQSKFNKLFSGARVTVERAIGVLKARYRILLKRLDSDITNVSDVIIACVVLHNFCNLENDPYMDEDGVLMELIRKETEARNLRRQNNVTHTNGWSVRDVLKRFVNL